MCSGMNSLLTAGVKAVIDITESSSVQYAILDEVVFRMKVHLSAYKNSTGLLDGTPFAVDSPIMDLVSTFPINVP